MIKKGDASQDSSRDLTLIKERLYNLLCGLYQLGDGRDGDPEWELHRARVRGFQEAARLLSLLDGEVVQSLIDQAHFDVLGESRLERSKRLDGLEAKAERGDWDFFENPAYARYKRNR